MHCNIWEELRTYKVREHKNNKHDFENSRVKSDFCSFCCLVIRRLIYFTFLKAIGTPLMHAFKKSFFSNQFLGTDFQRQLYLRNDILFVEETRRKYSVKMIFSSLKTLNFSTDQKTSPVHRQQPFLSFEKQGK